MSNLNLSTNDIYKNVTKKLKLQNLTQTRERFGDFYIDEKFAFKVKLPNEHGGNKTLSPLFLKACRDSVLLSSQEYANLVRCPMTGDEYEKLVRARIRREK